MTDAANWLLQGTICRSEEIRRNAKREGKPDVRFTEQTSHFSQGGYRFHSSGGSG
jgi:hypothetical protein